MHCTFTDDPDPAVKYRPVHNEATRTVELRLQDESNLASRATAGGDGQKVVDESRIDRKYKEGAEREFEDSGEEDTDEVLHQSQQVAQKSSQMPTEGEEQGRKEYSPRAQKGLKTQYRDGIYRENVLRSEEELVDLIKEDLEINESGPGYVNAFRDDEVNLIKIGSTKQFISTRLGQIQYEWRPGHPLEIVAGNDKEPTLDSSGWKSLYKPIYNHTDGFSAASVGRKRTRGIKSGSGSQMRLPEKHSTSGQGSCWNTLTVSSSGQTCIR